MTGSRTRALILAGVVAALAGIVSLAAGALPGIEDDTVDARFSVRGERPPAEMAVVAVDDVTFSTLQRQWPLPRSLYGRAVRRLKEAGAREVVVDVQFTEPTNPREDLALYDAIDEAGGVVLATTESDGRGNTNVLGGDENLRRVGATAAAANFPDQRSGVIRRMEHSVERLETIAVTVADRAGQPVRPAAFGGDGAWIDFRGPPGTFPTVSFSDLIQGKVDPRAFRDKIVVVGASSPTVDDVHPTSTTGKQLMSGPEVQANAIWTALRDFPLRSAPFWLDALFVLLLSVGPPLIAARWRVLAAALSAPLLALAYLAAAQGLFHLGTVVTVVPAALALVVSVIATIVASHLAESRERRRMAHLNEFLEERVRERTSEVIETEFEVIQRLSQAVESRDEETGEHIARMSSLCQRLALLAGMDREEAEMLRWSAAVHDVGKIGVPDAILLKPGGLDPAEWDLMKMHATIGASILAGSRSPLVRMAETIARTHHERWDGSGYPAGLAGEDIPLAGRICAICDSFDAMTSERPYKPAFSVDHALAEIARERGRQFDPKLADRFIAMIRADLSREADGTVEPELMA